VGVVLDRRVDGAALHAGPWKGEASEFSLQNVEGGTFRSTHLGDVAARRSVDGAEFEQKVRDVAHESVRARSRQDALDHPSSSAKAPSGAEAAATGLAEWVMVMEPCA
jgi:hypothetical protein